MTHGDNAYEYEKNPNTGKDHQPPHGSHPFRHTGVVAEKAQELVDYSVVWVNLTTPVQRVTVAVIEPSSSGRLPYASGTWTQVVTQAGVHLL